MINPDEIIYFAARKTVVDETDKEKLHAHAARLKADHKLVLTLLVHTDNRGSRVYNLAIADKWTNSIIRTLIGYDVNRKQIGIRLAPTRNTPAALFRSVELRYEP